MVRNVVSYGYFWPPNSPSAKWMISEPMNRPIVAQIGHEDDQGHAAHRLPGAGAAERHAAEADHVPQHRADHADQHADDVVDERGPEPALAPHLREGDHGVGQRASGRVDEALQRHARRFPRRAGAAWRKRRRRRRRGTEAEAEGYRSHSFANLPKSPNQGSTGPGGSTSIRLGNVVWCAAFIAQLAQSRKCRPAYTFIDRVAAC